MPLSRRIIDLSLFSSFQEYSKQQSDQYGGKLLTEIDQLVATIENIQVRSLLFSLQFVVTYNSAEYAC